MNTMLNGVNCPILATIMGGTTKTAFGNPSYRRRLRGNRAAVISANSVAVLWWNQQQLFVTDLLTARDLEN